MEPLVLNKCNPGTTGGAELEQPIINSVGLFYFKIKTKLAMIILFQDQNEVAKEIATTHFGHTKLVNVG